MLTKIMTKNYRIYWVAAVLSLIFASISQANYPIISIDATLYLHTANVYLTQGFHAAKATYARPFYPILIALLSKITGLNLLHTGYLLNDIFFILTVITYLACLKKLGATKLTQWLGLIIIFCFHHFTQTPYNLLRDNGYYTFYLFSIWLLLHFYQHPKWHYGILWGLSALIGTLFRIEGLVFLLLTPIISLFFPGDFLKCRLNHYIKLNIITAILAISLVVALSFHLLVLTHTGRLDNAWQQASHSGHAVLHSFREATLQLKTHVINGAFFGDYAPSILLFGLIAAYLQLVIKSLGLANAIMIIYGFVKRTIQSPLTLIIFAYLMLNLILTFAFLLQEMFLDARYVMAMDLTLLLFAPFGLLALYRQWQSNRTLKKTSTWLFYLVIVFLISQLISSFIHFGPSKKYLYNGANWIKHHVAANKIIYTNDPKIPFYIPQETKGVLTCNLNTPDNHCFNWETITSKPWQHSDYLVLDVDQSIPNQGLNLNTLGLGKPLKIFPSNRRNKLFIYAVHPD